MQSQQKRVKWSRGETAEALEERADTGITQASVELMENCIPDIYGNVSRRPALKPIPLSAGYPLATPAPYIGFTYEEGLQVVPFYITEKDIILIGVYKHSSPQFIRIQDGKIISKATATGTVCWSGITEDGVWVAKPISYAQQNNYLVLATETNVWKIQFSFNNDGTFTPVIDLWKYSAGWYAPNGTQTIQVSSNEITGLDFDASSVGNYTYTESNGETTVYSWIKTGLTSSAISATWTGPTTTYYVQYGQTNYYIKTSLDSGSTLVGTFTMTNNNTYTADQRIFTENIGILGNLNVYLRIHNDNAFFDMVSPVPAFDEDYDVSAYITPSTPALSQYIPVGCIVQFPNNGGYMRVEGYDSDGTNLRMYGALLTPIADDTAHDTIVKVEYGYQSLTPTEFSADYSYPHPKKLVFNNQRLWAGGWKDNGEEYAVVIGSQIARYNDLKNNYNQENEPITLDILTKFKEKITHLLDYNGLKIFTDAYEYTYESGTVVKQSSNGSIEQCDPLVFDSLCLYVDSTGQQIKAMQYEFQANIFNSSTINQLAPHDLVWFPIAMAQFEDKLNSTGKYLFVVNEDNSEHPRLAVCNFVPSNQANIWNRWSAPRAKIHPDWATVPLIYTVVNTKEQPIFMLNFAHRSSYGHQAPIVYPCVLDFDADVDLTTIPMTNNTFAVVKYTLDPGTPLESVQYLTIPSTEVAIYSNGVFQRMAQTDARGVIQDDLSQLTNVTVGLPINATIRSHPIDAGGKTKSIKKRIGKTVMSVHDTEPGAITINGKTGYMNPQKDKICFYGVTGMKDEIKYTLTNNNGAMFHLESLLMNIEYGTLDS